MSITVATSSVDTSWQEIDVTDWQAGTLAAIANCVTEVQDKLGRGTLSTTTKPSTTQVERYLIRAKEELAETKSFTWSRRFAYMETVVSQYRYSMPPDYNGGRVSIRDVTSGETPYRMQVHDKVPFDNRYPNPAFLSNNRPQVACVKGNFLWLSCGANGVYTLEMDYNRSGADVTADDLSYLPEIERFRICDYAIAECLDLIRDYEAADRYKQKWAYGIDKARKADGRRKWASKRFQCPVWFTSRTS